MPACVYHPAIETAAACSQCGRHFCGACLVEFLGQAHCGACRDRRLLQMQHPAQIGAPLRGTGQVEISGWIEAGWRIVTGNVWLWISAFLVVILLSVVLAVTVLGIVALPMLWAGLYLMAFETLTVGSTSFDTVFKGFRRSGPLLAASVTWLGAVLVPVLVVGGMVWGAYAFGGETGANIGAWGVVVCYYVIYPAACVCVPPFIFFAFPHVLATGCDPVTAVRASWEVVRRNYLMFLVVNLVLGLVAYLGTLACVVGVLVSYPVMIAAHARAYADHFGLDYWRD